MVLDELFDSRNVVGNRITEILESKSMTKVELCSLAHISRPTLDKLIAGNVTNKTSFINHMEKVLNALKMTPSMFMDQIPNPYVNSKSIRDALRINIKEIAEAIGVKQDDIRALEKGKKVKMSIVRDVALALGVGTDDILGNNYFPTQVAMASVFVIDKQNKGFREVTGYAGHLGILPTGATEYIWHPISEVIKSYVFNNINSDHLAIPCMDNTLLYINTDNIDDLIFADESCDKPYYLNCDDEVSEVEFPAVVYEVFSEYYADYINEGIKPDETEVSPLLWKAVCLLADKYNINEDNYYSFCDGIRIQYADGSKFIDEMILDKYETLTSEIRFTFEFGGDDSDKFIYFMNIAEYECLINKKKISFMEVPLYVVSKKIEEEIKSCQTTKEHIEKGVYRDDKSKE